MGIILPLIWSKFRRAGKVTLFAFLFSLTIEVLQLLSCYLGNMGRAFDIDDILLNTLGAFIGITLYTLYTNKITPKHKPEYEREEAT
jgi:glycopeptide antibiotics resistance protein